MKTNLNHNQIRTIRLNQLKEQGNELFRSNNFAGALKLYSQCIREHENRLEVPDNMHIYYNNRAMCKLQLSDIYGALEDADMALSFKNDFTKAHHTKIKALLSTHKQKSARKWASQHCPDVVIPEQLDDMLHDKKLSSEIPKMLILEMEKAKLNFGKATQEDKAVLSSKLLAQYDYLPEYNPSIHENWQDYLNSTARNQPQVQKHYTNLIQTHRAVEQTIVKILSFLEKKTPKDAYSKEKDSKELLQLCYYLEFLSCFPAAWSIIIGQIPTLCMLHIVNSGIGEKFAHYNRLFNITSAIIYSVEHGGKKEWALFEEHISYFMILFCSADNDQKPLMMLVNRLATFIPKWETELLCGEQYAALFWREFLLKVANPPTKALLFPSMAVIFCKIMLATFPLVILDVENAGRLEFINSVLFGSLFTYENESANYSETMLDFIDINTPKSDLSDWPLSFLEYFMPMDDLSDIIWPEEPHQFISFADNLQQLKTYPCLGEEALLGNLNAKPKHSMREICSRAVDMVLSRDFDINLDLLINLHNSVELRPQYVGFKTRNVDQNCVRARFVPALLEIYMTKIRSMMEQGTHPLTIASFALHGLITIHPFVDANGRVSRLFANAILLKLNYPILIFYDNRRYYETFRDYEFSGVVELVAECAFRDTSNITLSSEYLVEHGLHQLAVDLEFANNNITEALEIARSTLDLTSIPAGCDDFRSGDDCDYHTAFGMESMENFFARLPPSSTIGKKNWIFVSDQSFGNYAIKIIEVSDIVLQCLQNFTCYDRNAFTRIANMTQFFLGKWFIECTRDNVDANWKKILQATASLELTFRSKVSTLSQALRFDSVDANSFIICVFVEDYRDVENFMSVRNTLREMGWDKKLNFIRDIDTLARSVNGYPASEEEFYYSA